MIGATVNWKKIILWIAVAVVVLVAAVITTGILLLKYNHGFRHSLLTRVEESVYSSTGARLEVRDFKVSLTGLSLDIYGIIVHGTEPQGAPPLLTADHLNADINVDSLFGRKWHFRNITLDHPVAHLAVNKAGENNLPKSKKSGSSNTNLFDLGIRRLVLDQGAVYYNDRKTPLNADLHDLELTAGYDPTQQRYIGHMSYADGHVQYGSYAPLPHNLDAAFNLTPDRFTLDRLALSIGESHALLNATVENYSREAKLQANYDASLVTSEFAKILANPSVPSGTVHLTGFLNYQQQPNHPFLETASLYGMLSSSDLYVKTSSLQTSVRNLSAKYKLENGNAEVQNLHAEVLDGRLDGTFTVRDLTGAGRGRLQASLKDVSLDLLQKVANTTSLREAHLVGNVSADAQASWAKSLKNLVAHSDVKIDASLGQNPSTPLNGVIHADYLAEGQQIALHQSYIRTPQSSITLDGKISQLSQLQIRMHSNDLHEVESLAANFKTASASNGPAQPMNLHGTATLNATVSGSLKTPNIKGQLTANNLEVKGSSWKLLQTNISANPSQVTLSNGQLQSATQGRFNFNVQSRLNHWAYSPSNPIVVNLSGSAISIADLQHLANKDYPVAGTLSLNVSIHGTQQNPVGKGRITLANAKVSNEPIKNINLNFQGDGKALNANLVVHMPAGTTEAQGTYFPKTNSYQAEVKANGLQLNRLQTVKDRNIPLNGAVTFNASGRGTLKNPELLATIDVPKLQIQKQTIQGIKFQTHVQNHVADIALDSNVAQTYVKARGSVGIQAPYMANVHLDTGRVTFAPILAIYAPAQVNDLTGETELHAWLRGPLQHKDRVEAHLQIPMLSANYKQQVQLAAARPIQLDYQNGVAVLQPTSLEGTDTNVRLQANVPVKNLKAAFFLVQGTVDLRIAQAIEPTLQSTGQIQFDIDSRRYTAGNINGQVRIVNATVHTAESPIGLDHANGVISITKNRIEITNFEGAMGGGTITARGGVAYSPNVAFNLALAAKEIRIRYPEGLRTIVNSNLSVTGSTQAALVSGQVLIQHISFTPDFELSTFVGQFADSGTAAPSSSGFMQSVKLNVAVQSTSQMQLQSSQVSLSGNANLRIAGTAAMPVILGRANLTSGEMFLAGNRYVLQNGTIDFLNPVRTEAVVNIRAQTVIDQYNIALNIQGPTERLHTDYSSDPALPPVDIINLIAFGKTTESAAANPSPGGSMGAQSLLAQGVSSQVSSRVAKAVGLSHLSIDPALGGNGQDPGARIAIQQRVTSNLYVTFASDVTSTQRQAVEMQYQLNPKWSLSGVRDQNGGFGGDVHYKKDF